MKAVSYILIIYFTLGSLFPKSDFAQFRLLGELKEHYALHKTEAAQLGNELTFTHFLFIHFVEQNSHENHNHEHEGLPFYTSSSTSFLFVQIIIEKLENTVLDHPLASFYFLQNAYYNPFINKIIQPPNSLH